MSKGVKFNDMYECNRLAHELLSKCVSETETSLILDPDIVDNTYDCYMSLTGYNEKMTKRLLLLDYCLLKQMEEICAKAGILSAQTIMVIYPIRDRLFEKIWSIEEEP